MGFGKRPTLFCMCGHTRTRHAYRGGFDPLLEDEMDKEVLHCFTCECPKWDEFPKTYGPSPTSDPPVKRYPRRMKD